MSDESPPKPWPNVDPPPDPEIDIYMKGLPSKGSSLFWIVVFTVTFLLGIGFARLCPAQGYIKRDDKPEAEKKAKIEFQVDKWSVGFGSFFDDPSVTFSTKAIYVAAQFHGIGLPIIKEGTSTGIAIEGHPASIITKDVASFRVQAIENVDWRLWSTTRVPLSATRIKRLSEGTPARMFSGIDVLIAEGGPIDYTDGFDARFVMGGDMGRIGPGTLVFEIYSFQQNVPISFAVFYGF